MSEININPIQQLTKTIVNDETGEYKCKNIFPVSILNAIFDKNSKKSLIDILISMNCIYVPWKGSNSATRNAIDKSIRRKGLMVVFVDNTSTINSQIYNNTSISDSYWGADANWVSVGSGNNIKLGYVENGDNYAVKVDENNNAYVTVPKVEIPEIEIPEYTNYVLPVATSTTLGGVKESVTSPVVIGNDGFIDLQYKDMSVKDNTLHPYKLVTWDDTKDLNAYVDSGIYRITGTRTVDYDNLPVEGTGEDYNIDCMLFVLDSSTSGNNSENSKCVTQFIIVSDRANSQANAFIRVGVAQTKNAIIGGAWGAWQKLNCSLVTQESDGMMSKEDKAKLDGLTGANIEILTQENYDSLEVKNSQTVYFIKG